MIYNQVLEQFGDWIIFWNNFKLWFMYPELDLEWFIDYMDNATSYNDFYRFKKQQLETLLEEIGYEDVKLTSHLTTKEERMDALLSKEVQYLTAASYEMKYPHLISSIDRYKSHQLILRMKNGEDLLYLMAPSSWLIKHNEQAAFAYCDKINKFNQLHMIKYERVPSPLNTLAELIRFNAEMKSTASTVRNFDLWKGIPLPNNVEELEKGLKLFFHKNLTNEMMDEVGVIRDRVERSAFLIEEQLRLLKPYRTDPIPMSPLNPLDNARVISWLYLQKGEAMTPYPTRGIVKEDPALTFPFKELIKCEILKQEFFRSVEVKDIPTLQFSAFVYNSIRYDIVEEMEKRLDEYYLSLHYHMIGLWLRIMREYGYDFGVAAVTTWKFTQFTYFLFFAFFLSLFFFFTRKIFYSGWWKGNVKIVSFIFNLIKEQSSIRAIIHLPLLLTIFVWILINNLLGLFPFGYAITSHILFTFFLGFSLLVGITILIWQEKKKEMIQLFLPKGVPSFLVPFLFVIEVISYIFRTVSLSVRLFANMMAGHALLHILTNFGLVISSISSPLRFFFIFPLVIVALITFLELGIALLQAYVFTVLLAIYLNDVYSLESH